jgi:hypothetical protein
MIMKKATRMGRKIPLPWWLWLVALVTISATVIVSILSTFGSDDVKMRLFGIKFVSKSSGTGKRKSGVGWNETTTATASGENVTKDHTVRKILTVGTRPDYYGNTK